MKKNKLYFKKLKNYSSLLFLFSILCILISLTSCTSNSRTEEKLYANYYLRYLQPDEQVKAEVNFSKGENIENAKPVKMENGVFFHGGDMNMKNLPQIGIRYSATRKGAFSNEYKFRFTPPGQKKIEHTLIINSLDNISISPSITKSKGMQIAWNGKPLLENESLAFLFKNEKNEFASFEINGATSSSGIIIDAKKLEPLTEGKAELYLVRKQSNLEEQPNVIILSETEFYSRVFSVTILP